MKVPRGVFPGEPTVPIKDEAATSSAVRNAAVGSTAGTSAPCLITQVACHTRPGIKPNNFKPGLAPRTRPFRPKEITRPEQKGPVVLSSQVVLWGLGIMLDTAFFMLSILLILGQFSRTCRGARGGRCQNFAGSNRLPSVDNYPRLSDEGVSSARNRAPWQ
jgi:hypothetical protein